jgi:hypothetical protein
MRCLSDECVSVHALEAAVLHEFDYCKEVVLVRRADGGLQPLPRIIVAEMGPN